MGGGDKFLRELGGQTILARIVDRAGPQVGALVLNANGDPARFAAFGLPVATDAVEGYAGPLAGVLTGMEWAAANAPGTAWVASFACDTPVFPEDMVARMVAAVQAARSPGRGAILARAVPHGSPTPSFGLGPPAPSPAPP